MNNKNGSGGADDFSFGFSEMDGWLSGTDGRSDVNSSNAYITDNGFNNSGDVNGSNAYITDDGFNNSGINDYESVFGDEYSEPDSISVSAGTYNESDEAQVYDRPAEDGEYSEAYEKALSKVSRHKEDKKSIWQYSFGESNGADFGMPDWPARHEVEKYKYGDVAVKRPRFLRALYGRSHLAAKIMFVSWLAVSIVLTAVFFSKREYWTIIWGTMQITAGICAYFALLPRNRLKKFPVFLVVDALLTGGIIAFRFAEPRGFAALSENMKSIFGGLFFAIVGVITVTFGSVVLFRSLSRCSVKIMGMCMNYVRVGTRGSTTVVYCPIYEFFYNKRKYIVRPDSYTSAAPPERGKMYKLRINPLNPTDYFDVKRDGNLYVIVIVCGAIFAVTSSIFFIVSIINAFLSVYY